MVILHNHPSQQKTISTKPSIFPPIMMKKDSAYWIKKLDLKKHPEGGYFRQTYQSKEMIAGNALPNRFIEARPISTAIYYLLNGNEFSAFHRLKSDELWHFYTGSSLTLHLIAPDGKYFQIKLGNNIDNGELFQEVIKAGCWFGATVNDFFSYSLVGCTVAPGFSFKDFEIGNRKALIELYPKHKIIIEKLTR